MSLTVTNTNTISLLNILNQNSLKESSLLTQLTTGRRINTGLGRASTVARISPPYLAEPWQCSRSRVIVPVVEAVLLVMRSALS